jgi:hypothetical protein
MTFATQEDRKNTLDFNGVSLGRHSISIEIPDAPKPKTVQKVEVDTNIRIQDREVQNIFLPAPRTHTYFISFSTKAPLLMTSPSQWRTRFPQVK